MTAQAAKVSTDNQQALSNSLFIPTTARVSSKERYRERELLIGAFRHQLLHRPTHIHRAVPSGSLLKAPERPAVVPSSLPPHQAVKQEGQPASEGRLVNNCQIQHTLFCAADWPGPRVVIRGERKILPVHAHRKSSARGTHSRSLRLFFPGDHFQEQKRLLFVLERSILFQLLIFWGLGTSPRLTASSSRFAH